MKGDDTKCKDAGMDAHLTKPIDRDALRVCLEKYLPVTAAASRRQQQA
jgi:CheY-like chemotaxis protein